MNLMLNVKDINRILAKTHFKCQKKLNKNPHFCENMSPCHAFTSPSSSKTTKELPESNEYNWSTEFEGI